MLEDRDSCQPDGSAILLLWEALKILDFYTIAAELTGSCLTVSAPHLRKSGGGFLQFPPANTCSTFAPSFCHPPLIVLQMPHSLSQGQMKSLQKSVMGGWRTFQGCFGEADLISDLPWPWGLLWTGVAVWSHPETASPSSAWSEDHRNALGKETITSQTFFSLNPVVCRVHTRERCYYTSNASLIDA